MNSGSCTWLRGPPTISSPRCATPKGNLLHVVRAGSARIPAYLDDYAAAILGLVELHRVTGESRWREEAGRLGSAMVEHLREPSGRFRYTDPLVGFLIAESRDTFDGAFPAGNSLAVRALTGLAGIGYPEYRRHAEGILTSFAPLLREHPAALPYMLWGLHEFLSVKVSGPGSGRSGPGLPSTAELLQIRGSLSPDRFPPGEPVEITVTLTIENGWHVNANPASLDSLVPTTLVAAVEGTESSFIPRYPPETVIPIGPEKDRISVYENRVILGGTITTAGTGSKNREGRVTVSVQAQACNETGQCLAPSSVEIRLPFYLAHRVIEWVEYDHFRSPAACR